MTEVELHFGTLCVIIRDDKKELSKIKDIAHQTLLALLPEAEKLMKVNKINNANGEVGDECDCEEESCSPEQICGKCRDVMNHLYG
jgi:hypothetical protein